MVTPAVAIAMWIKNTDTEEHPIRRLRNEHTLGELVEFTSNWKAQVSDDVGESLIEHYSFIEENASNSN